jgi:adenylate cyclase
MYRREKGIFILGVILTGVFSLLLSWSTLGVRFDAVIHDQVYDTRTRDEVRIVGIDDKSLQSLGAWPWKRDIFANALTTLYKKGARNVVFDVLFLEVRDGDLAMQNALKNTGATTLFASKLDQDKVLLESVYKNTPNVSHGIAHVYPDGDGKVRTIPLSQTDVHGTCSPSLAYQAFITFTKQTDVTCDTNPRWFLFQEKAPKTFSFIDVLHGDVPDEEIRDKVIFIGSNSLDIEDHFIGQTGEKIPGVYVHASIFTTLLNNSFLQSPNKLLYVLAIVILVAFGLLVIFRVKNIFLQGALLFGGALICIVCTLVGFSLHYLMSLSMLLFPYLFISMYGIFYRYIATERKNTYIKELFGQYVHPKVLSHILKSNNLKLGGEKKYITILFSDIRGFTTLTENMTPEKLVETLNAYLETMSPIIMKHDGVIDKYIGDAIMAFWNAPVEVNNHEEKAVRSSLAMIDALSKMKTETPLAIGIGLHAGEAIVGNIGSRARINYTIIGDAVNACSRLEGLTKKYGLQIIVSEQIKNAITSSDIIWRPVDIVRVKGKSEVMKLYEPMLKTDEHLQTIHDSSIAFTHYIDGDFDTARTLYKKNK